MFSYPRPKRSLDVRVAWAALLGVLFPLRLFHRALVSVGVSDAVLLFAAMTAVRRQEWRQWLELRKDTLARWIAVFSAVTLLALLVGRLRLGHWIWWGLINRGLALPASFCVYCLFATVPKQRVWFYLRSFLIAGSILNVPALMAVAIRYELDRGSVFFFSYSSLRLSGLMHNPNAYGGFLAALLSVQLSALAFGKLVFGRIWLDWANVAAVLAAATFTISRGSWLAMLAGAMAVLVVAAAVRYKIPLRTRDIVPGAVVAVASLGLLFLAGGGGLAAVARDGVAAHTTTESAWIYFPQGPASFGEFLRIARDPSGVGDRLAIDRIALKLYATSASKMVFGLGLGVFEEMSSATRLQTTAMIHNSYLWALVELGPLGALCLLVILLKTLRRLWQAILADDDGRPSLAALLAALLACCVWCLSNDGLFQRHLWFLLGLATAATAATRSRTEDPVIEAERAE